MHEMTGRERFLKAMNFEMTDRLPIMANGIGSIKYVMKLTGLSEDEYWADQPGAHFQAMRILGMDFNLQLWFPPRMEASRDWSHGEVNLWSDPDVVVEDIERVISGNAVMLAELEMDKEAEIRSICQYQQDVQRHMGPDLFWMFGMERFGPHIIYFPYGKYGYEGFFLTVALYPEVMGRYWASHAELARVHNECVVEAAVRLGSPKIGYCGDDMTDQRGNLIAPEVMAQYYFPHLSHAIEPLINAGFKLIWHSDGNMYDMLRPLIDIGIAGFQGFQEECGTKIADVSKLRNRNGDPLILWGSCSVIDVLRTGSFADIRREIQRVLDEWPHPGLCLATSSYLSPDVPEENITEFYRLCREMGNGRERVRSR